MDTDILQYIGFLASIIIALSMTMNSILKFRWINLAGATTFSIYGFLIGAYPVGLLNAFIVSVDVYYLVRIYTKKNFFDILEIKSDNRYLIKFLDFHQQEIQKFFPGFVYKPELNSISFFVLRDMQVAGIFLAHRTGADTMKVGLDYVVPEYRDYRNGKFLYYGLQCSFVSAGFRRAIADSISPKHEKYLRRVGFAKATDGTYVKNFPL
jgi:hypothetical protein